MSSPDTTNLPSTTSANMSSTNLSLLDSTGKSGGNYDEFEDESTASNGNLFDTDYSNFDFDELTASRPHNNSSSSGGNVYNGNGNVSANSNKKKNNMNTAGGATSTQENGAERLVLTFKRK